MFARRHGKHRIQLFFSLALLVLSFRIQIFDIRIHTSESIPAMAVKYIIYNIIYQGCSQKSQETTHPKQVLYMGHSTLNVRSKCLTSSIFFKFCGQPHMAIKL